MQQPNETDEAFGNYEERLYLQVVASEDWKWLDGMSFISQPEIRQPLGSRRRFVEGMQMLNSVYPALEDPATKGCLLHLLRDVYDSLEVIVEYNTKRGFPNWEVWIGPTYVGGGKTEGGALAEALIMASRLKLSKNLSTPKA